MPGGLKICPTGIANFGRKALEKARMSRDETFMLDRHRECLGTTDQHSQVQLYREGPNDKLFTFLQVKL